MKRYLTARSLAADAGFSLFNTLVLGVVVLVTLYPFWNTVVLSFNQATDSTRGGIYFWPRIWTWQNYKAVWLSTNIPHALFISVARALTSTVLNLFLTSMLAYALSRREYVLRRPLTLIIVVSLYVNAGLFPSYFLIRSLHLANSFWVYIVPTLINGFNFIVLRTYIKTIPESIFESARMDGTGDFPIFLRFVLPLSKPALATVALFVAVGSWNSWFDTVLYASSKPELFTLQYQLMSVLQASMNQSKSAADVNSLGMNSNITASIVTPTSIRSSITIIATAPILLVYPFLQKYFVVGLNVGSIKE